MLVYIFTPHPHLVLNSVRNYGMYTYRAPSESCFELMYAQIHIRLHAIR